MKVLSMFGLNVQARIHVSIDKKVIEDQNVGAGSRPSAVLKTCWRGTAGTINDRFRPIRCSEATALLDWQSLAGP